MKVLKHMGLLVLFLPACFSMATSDICADQTLSVHHGENAILTFSAIPTCANIILATFGRGRDISNHGNIGVVSFTIRKTQNNGKYEISVDQIRKEVILKILNVTHHDGGMYVVQCKDKKFFSTALVKIFGGRKSTDNELLYNTVFARPSATAVIHYNDWTNYYFFKHRNSSFEYKEIKNPAVCITKQPCFTIEDVSREHEGCYVFWDDYFGAFNDAVVLRLYDAMLIVDKKSITCKINTSGTNFYLQLQHSYGENIIRQIKALARCAVSLPFLSVPYYNNGQYRCLIKDTRGMVSLNETVTTYVFSGIPVFVSDIPYIASIIPKTNNTISIFVYSKPNIRRVWIEKDKMSNGIMPTTKIHNIHVSTSMIKPFKFYEATETNENSDVTFTVGVQGYKIVLYLQVDGNANVTLFVQNRQGTSSIRIQIYSTDQDKSTTLQTTQFLIISVVFNIILIVSTSTVCMKLMKDKNKNNISTHISNNDINEYDEIGYVGNRQNSESIKERTFDHHEGGNGLMCLYVAANEHDNGNFEHDAGHREGDLQKVTKYTLSELTLRSENFELTDDAINSFPTHCIDAESLDRIHKDNHSDYRIDNNRLIGFTSRTVEDCQLQDCDNEMHVIESVQRSQDNLDCQVRNPLLSELSNISSSEAHTLTTIDDNNTNSREISPILHTQENYDFLCTDRPVEHFYIECVSKSGSDMVENDFPEQKDRMDIYSNLRI